MKIVMVSCFANKDTYGRGNTIYNYFIKNNYQCLLIYSEFNHNAKKYQKMDDISWIPIKTISYRKNLSIKRMISHIIFAWKSVLNIIRIKPNLLYIAIPPNSAAFFACIVAKKLKIPFIIDIVDLWPESFQISPGKKWFMSYIFKIWEGLRNNPLKNASAIIYECDYYKNYIEIDKHYSEKSFTIYLTKIISQLHYLNNSKYDVEINICYIGSINYLIDIEFLTGLLCEINKIKPVVLHIIGTGEKKDIVISKLYDLKVKFIDYGQIYDENQKMAIMSKCDFGYNVYNDRAIIGLTYKSVDYFFNGLPIINSIKGDTWKIVDEKMVGINVAHGDYISAAKTLLSFNKDKINEMKGNAFNIYSELFSYGSFEQKMDLVLKTIINK